MYVTAEQDESIISVSLCDIKTGSGSRLSTSHICKVTDGQNVYEREAKPAFSTLLSDFAPRPFQVSELQLARGHSPL